jgi:hypothetical protein
VAVVNSDLELRSSGRVHNTTLYRSARPGQYLPLVGGACSRNERE